MEIREVLEVADALVIWANYNDIAIASISATNYDLDVHPLVPGKGAALASLLLIVGTDRATYNFAAGDGHPAFTTFEGVWRSVPITIYGGA